MNRQLRPSVRRTSSWAALLGLMLSLLVTLAAPASAVPSSCVSNGISVTSVNPPTFYMDGGVTPKLDAGYAGYVVTSTAARSDLWVGVSDFAGGSVSLASSQPAALPLGAVTAGGHAPAFFLLTASAPTSTAQTHTVTVYSGVPGTASATMLCTSTGSFTGVSDTIKAAANKL